MTAVCLLAAVGALLGAVGGTGPDYGALPDPFENVLTGCSSGGGGGPAFPFSDAVGLLHDFAKNVNCSNPEVGSACRDCLNASILALDSGNSWVPTAALQQTATRLLYLTLNQSAGCQDGNGSAINSSLQSADSELMPFYTALGNDTASRTSSLLDMLTRVYREDNSSRSAFKCFNAHSLMLSIDAEDMVNITSEQLLGMASRIVALTARGYSIDSDCPLLPSDRSLRADLLRLLNATSSELPLHSLLSKLGIGNKVTGDERAERDHDDHHDDHEDHDHGPHSNHHLDHLHKRELVTLSDVLDSNSHSDDAHSHGHEHNESFQCLSTSQLMAIYNLEEHEGLVNFDSLQSLCPALLQQLLGGYCSGSTPSPATAAAPRAPSTAETYGYGTLAVLTVGAMPLLGIVLIPCLQSQASTMVLTFFVALGAGAMLGDALLHLIPSILGEHNHRHEDLPTGESLVVPETTWKMLVMCLVIYAFFVMEMVVTIVKRKLHPSEGQHFGHGHSHLHAIDPAKKVVRNATLAKSETLQEFQAKGNDDTVNVKDGKDEIGLHMTSAESSDCIMDPEHTGEKGCGAEARGCNVSPMVLILMMGDALHNFADGLTIGASFATRLTLGVTTTIAIVSHEVPHKLANIAVLLSAGYKQRTVFCFSLMSTCSAIISFYVGAVVGTNETVASYIFAATAASFFYVCLLDLLPEIMHQETESPWIQFIVMNIGILFGFAFMLLFSIYEDKIDIE